MNGGSRIIAFGSSEDGATESAQDGGDAARIEGQDDPLELQADWDAGEAAEPLPGEVSPFARGAIAAALVAIAAWTGFYVWANLAVFTAGTAPSQWAALVTGWTMPVLLVCVIWLIAMRSSAREATRFGNAARLLSGESQALEARLIVVNRELSLAREFLASQTRDLEALGRVATERLSQNAQRLAELVGENGARVDTIGQVSATALDNMEKLRGQLPVISSSAKDVANNIGNAGRTAHAQLEEMVRGFKRLNEFGQACEAQVHTVRDIVERTLAEFSGQSEEFGRISTERFAELQAIGNHFRTRLDKDEVDALAAIRHRASSLAEELDAARAQLAEAESASMVALNERLAVIGRESEAISGAIAQSRDQAVEHWRGQLAAIDEDRGALFARIEHADAQAVERWRANLAAIDEERGALFARIESADAQAVERWRGNLAAIDEEHGALFARIEQTDARAVNMAHERLGAISAEAELIESGIAQRAERLLADLNARRAAAEAAEREVVDRFSQLLAAIDAELAERAASHQRQAQDLTAQIDGLRGKVGESEADIARIARLVKQSGEGVSTGLADIAQRLDEAQGAIAQTGTGVFDLTDSSVRLLELLRASAEQAGVALPLSLQAAEQALNGAEERTRNISIALTQAGKSGEWLGNQIDGAGASLGEVLEQIGRMQIQLREQAISHQDTLNGLSGSLREIEQQGDSLSHKARTELAEAVAALEGSARDAVRLISTEGSAGVTAIVEQLSESSAEAISKALRHGAAEASGQLEQAAAHAAGISREATVQLRDQLAKVNELVANLESRVNRARERAEEQVNNDFSRRAALITEALNSSAIDIARAMSTEVSDTAWEAYLRGDRGIFTRRAVNLIENGEARAIQQIFERDGDFREHVSRYIHDFESMLRQVLSTRDGTALGVTLLSSDMGKLYVALAQGIQRLRA